MSSLKTALIALVVTVVGGISLFFGIQHTGQRTPEGGSLGSNLAENYDPYLRQNGGFTTNLPIQIGSPCGVNWNTGDMMHICGSDNTTSGIQMGTINTNAGSSAYNGIYFNNDQATDNLTDNYGFIGQNSSAYSDTTFGTGTSVPFLLFMQNSDGPITFETATTSTARAYINFIVASSSVNGAGMRLTGAGNLGVGTTTAVANFQVTASAANATTSVEFGKASQNKGTCLTFFDTAGTAVYAYIAGGATSLTFTTTQPSGCQL